LSEREKVDLVDCEDGECICCRFQPGTRGQYKKVPLLLSEVKEAADFAIMRRETINAREMSDKRLGKTLLFTCKMLKGELVAWRQSTFAFSGVGARRKHNIAEGAQELIPSDSAMNKMQKDRLAGTLATVRTMMFSIDAPRPIDYSESNDGDSGDLPDDMTSHPLFNFQMPDAATEATRDHDQAGVHTSDSGELDLQGDVGMDADTVDARVAMAVQLSTAFMEQHTGG
jgi:hypothetical protein